MSIFQTETVPCPACQADLELEVAYSVFADRRPDLRLAILDNTLQRETCIECGETFRLEPELTYLDVSRRLWLLLLPADRLTEWPDLEGYARSLFETAYGPGAAPAARELGADLRVRVTFGWLALREKVFLAERSLDDTIVELTKLALIRTQKILPLADDVELRLTDLVNDELVMTWVRAATEQPEEALRVPKAVYDGIAADPAAWAALTAELTAGPFVDIHRLLVPVETEPADTADGGESAAGDKPSSE